MGGAVRICGLFERDWYVSLRRGGSASYELALLDYRHPTLPAAFRAPARGLLLNFEVEDVDEEWDRLVVRTGVQPELVRRSEEFSQRHFIVADPNGVLIDVITPIAPSPAFVAPVRRSVMSTAGRRRPTGPGPQASPPRDVSAVLSIGGGSACRKG